MIADLAPYRAMRDSHVPWLGKIPVHWEIARNGRLFAQRNETGFPELPILEVSLKTGVRVRDFEGSNRKQVMTDKDKYKRARAGDIAYNMMRMWQGAVGVAPVDGLVSPAYVVARPVEGTTSEYFERLFRLPAYMAEVNRYSRGIVSDRNRLYWEDFKQIVSPFPPPSEQGAIVRFLNSMDRRIRCYIRAKQKLITLLEEQKQAIIHHFVTRGLDPDVRLKATGVEWLGHVPEHWRVLQIRRLISFLTSGSRGWAKFYSDEGDIFIQSGNLGRSMTLDLRSIQYVRPPAGAEGQRTRVRRDDLLICITGALTGNVVHVADRPPKASFVNQHVALLRPNRGLVVPRYLAYVLYSDLGQLQFKSGEYGGTKQGLGLDEVKSTLVPVPSLPAQRMICSELDEAMSRYALLTTAVQKELALLREYRTRLIADVVTGKLDVREAAARLAEEVEETPYEADKLTDPEEAMLDTDTIPEEAEV